MQSARNIRDGRQLAGDESWAGIARPRIVDRAFENGDGMRGQRRGAQSGGGVGGVGGARGHNNRLEAGDGAGDGGDGGAGVFDFAVPQRAAARPSHPATLVRRPFGGHRKAALRGRFLHFSILPRRAFRRGKAANDWRKMRLVNPQNGSNMKKTIFTFFVACNLAMSGFFAVLATSPALAAECPLCEAAQEKNIAEIRRLLNDGANPNQADVDGFTALMGAAFAGHTQIAKALLDSDANPNQAAKIGWTALMLAAADGTFRGCQSVARQRRRSESGRKKSA